MSTEQDQKQALIEIAEKTGAARALITQAEALADKAGVTFYFDVAYGMGGTYYPKKTDEQKEAERKKADEDGSYYQSNASEGWNSSSNDR